MRLYESNIPSGNAYKVSLLLSHLRLPYETTTLDILQGETRTPEFLAKNPNGRIPLLELDDGRRLPESGAILSYLAEGTPFLPSDRFEHAETLSWMFFEQYSHEPYVAVMAFWTYWGGLDKLSEERIAMLRERWQAALDVMAQHLSERRFFVGNRYTIADIALYAYTQSAEGIGYDVPDPIRAWFDRVREQPGYVPKKADPLGRAPQLP